MKKLALVGLMALAIWYAPQPKAYANDIVDGVYAVGGWGRSALVITDKVLHWTWDTLHNKVVHPMVNVLTVGTVDLNTPE